MAAINARWICKQAHQQLKEELGLTVTASGSVFVPAGMIASVRMGPTVFEIVFEDGDPVMRSGRKKGGGLRLTLVGMTSPMGVGGKLPRLFSCSSNGVKTTYSLSVICYSIGGAAEADHIVHYTLYPEKGTQDQVTKPQENQ